MEFFFADPNVERLPPSDTRLLDLRAEPDPDGARIRVSLDLTPFQQRPYIELTLQDASGREISSASIIEPVGWKLELTLHIRKVPMPIPETHAESKIEGIYSKTISYVLSASLSYPELGQVDQRQITVLVRTQ